MVDNQLRPDMVIGDWQAGTKWGRDSMRMLAQLAGSAHVGDACAPGAWKKSAQDK